MLIIREWMTCSKYDASFLILLVTSLWIQRVCLCVCASNESPTIDQDEITEQLVLRMSSGMLEAEWLHQCAVQMF